MTRTKYFTDQATGGSTGEASAEEMMRGYSDAGDGNPMADDNDWTWFMPQDGGGGFLGRPQGWER